MKMSASAAIPVANFYEKCFTCLSVDRHLQPLQEIVLLGTLCPQVKLDPLESGTFYFICWECNATINKIKKFQASVLTAHDNLIQFKKDAPSLSRLSITKGPIVTILPSANTASVTQITNTEPTPTETPILAPITPSTTGPTLILGPMTTSNTIPTPICASNSERIESKTSPRVFFPTTIATSKPVQPNASNTTIETTTSLEITIDPLITDIKEENEDIDEDKMDFDDVIEPTTIKEVGNNSGLRDTASETETDQSDQLKTKNKKEKQEKDYFVPINYIKIEPNEPVPSVSNELLVERTSEAHAKINLKHKTSKIPNAPSKLLDLIQTVELTVDPDKATESNLIKTPNIRINSDNIQKPQEQSTNNIPTYLNNSSNSKKSDCILTLNQQSGRQVSSVGDLVSNLVTNFVSNASSRQVPHVVKPATKIDEIEIECEKQIYMYGFKEDEIRCRRITKEEMAKFREAKVNDRFYQKAEFRCTKCLVWFRSKPFFDEHNKQHDVKAGDHVCEVCELRFPTPESLTAHDNKHYMLFECMVCKWQTQERFKISSHYQKRHQVDKFLCKKCKISFNTFEERKRHIKEVHLKLTCPVCSKEISCKFNLQLHMATHDNEETQCEVCKKNVKKALLQRHMIIHKPPDPHHCIECNSTFRNKGAYEYHMKTTLRHNSVENLIRFKCDHCGKMFAKKYSLVRHIEAEHEVHPVSVCEVCKKECKSKTILLRHMKYHEEKKLGKRFVCDICGLSMSEKSSLKEHMNKHTGLRPYKCQDCGNTFSYSGALFTHRRLVHKVKRKKDLLKS